MALPTKKLVAGVATAALSAWFSTANAQQNNVMGAVAPGAPTAQQLRSEPWMKAQDYSMENPIMTFAVYGRTEQFTTQQLAEQIQSAMLSQNIETKYYLGMEDRLGVTVGFYIDGVPYGPEPASKVPRLMHEVAADYKQSHPERLVNRVPAFAQN